MGKKTLVEVEREIKEELERLGYEYIDDRMLTRNPDDWYLRVVLAKNKREHVVWIYNASLESMQSGEYFDSGNQEKTARERFETRE